MDSIEIKNPNIYCNEIGFLIALLINLSFNQRSPSSFEDLSLFILSEKRNDVRQPAWAEGE